MRAGFAFATHRNSIKGLLQKLLFGSKWILIVYLVILLVVQGVFCAKFIEEIFHSVMHFSELSRADVTIVALESIDFVLMAILIILIIVGSYQTSLESVSNDSTEINSLGGLKVKIATAIIIIGVIQLLTSMLYLGNAKDLEELVRMGIIIFVQCFIQAIFLLTGKVLGDIDYQHSIAKHQVKNAKSAEKDKVSTNSVHVAPSH